MQIFLLTVLLALIVLVVQVLRQSDVFFVQRTGFIIATPAQVFAHINNLRKWEAWSPWAKLDPSAKTTYSGPEQGPGAAFAWDGDRKKLGAGRMTITQSIPDRQVDLRLDFEAPMKSTSQVTFELEAEDGGTKVTWRMTGRNNFVGKCVNIVMDCEKMVGDMYAKGLANLRQTIEHPKA